jgi:hypothetical protein
MKFLVTLVAALLLQEMAVSQDLSIYPARNQSKQQMEKDKLECYSWAKDQTGFDPMAAPEAAPAQPQQKKSVAGGAAKSGARGSVFGLGIGAVTGSAAKGAARGALVGGTLGAVRSSAQNKKAREAQNQREQEQLAEYQRGRDNYDNAYSACLEGRGYTVR